MTLKQKTTKKLKISQQKEYMRQILLALKELYDKKIAHRDLKPDNVMIRQTSNGEECVLIDFGLATNIDKE